MKAPIEDGKGNTFPFPVLKQDYRRGEIAPLDACQVSLMGYTCVITCAKARESASFTKGIRNEYKMKLSLSHSEQVPMHTALKFQRMSLAACIILAPLSISLYLVT